MLRFCCSGDAIWLAFGWCHAGLAAMYRVSCAVAPRIHEITVWSTTSKNQPCNHSPNLDAEISDLDVNFMILSINLTTIAMVVVHSSCLQLLYSKTHNQTIWLWLYSNKHMSYKKIYPIPSYWQVNRESHNGLRGYNPPKNMPSHPVFFLTSFRPWQGNEPQHRPGFWWNLPCLTLTFSHMKKWWDWEDKSVSFLFGGMSNMGLLFRVPTVRFRECIWWASFED